MQCQISKFKTEKRRFRGWYPNKFILRQCFRNRKKIVKSFLSGAALNAFFLICCFLALLPILYALSVSLDAEGGLLSSNFSFIPKAFTLNHYRAVLYDEPVIAWFSNTVLLTVSTVLLSMAAAVPAASPVTAQQGITRIISHILSVTLVHLPAVMRFLTLFE